MFCIFIITYRKRHRWTRIGTAAGMAQAAFFAAPSRRRGAAHMLKRGVARRFPPLDLSNAHTSALLLS